VVNLNKVTVGLAATGLALVVLAALYSDAPLASAAPPANDNLANAIQLTFPGASNIISAVEATTEGSEPIPSCGASAANSLWFKAQAETSDIATADALLTSYDTVLAVYSGPASSPTFGSLTPIACNDNHPGGANPLGSRVSFPVTSGNWYYFQVTRATGSAGNVGLRIGFIANDNLADAEVLTTPQVPGQVAAGSVFMATDETNENVPTCAGSVTPGVWYTWTSPAANGHVVFDTFGSSMDTVLAVYTGSSFPLTEVSCDDEYDFDASGPSLAPVFYTGATTFYIQVRQWCDQGCFSPAGNFILNMSLGSTLIVTESTDNNASDLGLNLREAMLMTQGLLGRAPGSEEDQLPGFGITAGSGSADLVHVDFRCFSIFCIGPVGVPIGSQLPTLAGTGDVISNKGRSVLVDGQDQNFNCILITGSSNRVEGLGMHNCDGASFPAAIRVTGNNNVIGSAPAGPGLPFVRKQGIFYENGVGVAFNSPGTGNRVVGNQFGIDELGGPKANDLGVAVTGANNFIGGPGADGNLIRASAFEQIVVRNATATGNTIQGNEIGGLGSITGAWGVRFDTSAANNVLGGSGPGEGNVISGNTIGVLIQSGPNTLLGNKIGTDVAGSTGKANTTGISIQGPAANNIIGGTTAGARNVIASSTNEGIVVNGSSGNTIRGNYIGTDVAGTGALPNGVGVKIFNNSPNNFIGGIAAGEGNTIAFNTGAGVNVDGATAIGNRIRGNSIHSNGALGIDNTNGGNGEPTHAPPVVTGAGSAAGTSSCPNCIIDVFSDGVDEGRKYEGSTLADEGGAWLFPGPTSGPKVTATVTRGDGSTSELSNAFTCTDGDGDGVCTSADNCPVLVNPNQANSDADGQGDACDNCPTVTNPLQTNSDGDSFGDSCDNCPTTTNANQANSDGDGVGDACDNCPATDNQAQTNSDGDDYGDACDNCPNVTNHGQEDTDGDNFGDVCDNCPTTASADQADFDADGQGNACDVEDDGDGYSDLIESGNPFCANNLNDDGSPVSDDTLPNDGCPAVGPAETNCINNLDDDADTFVNDGCDPAGNFSEGQFKIGTGSLDACGQTGWPSDVFSSGASANKLTIQDVISYITIPRKLDKNPGETGFDSRWDLVTGRGILGKFININDITALVNGTTGNPPMFNNTRAFDKVCPFAP
jgi:hypothetical protein